MKILLTGGGSGGHFYPIIAVAEALNKIAREEKLVDMKLYYMAPQPYDRQLLYDNGITFVKGTAGKSRQYFSILNFLDYFRTAWGIVRAVLSIYRVYPDVIFSKGGYVSFPAMVAARLLRIPVIIHESDSAPGRVNVWSGKFANRIAISYPEAAEFFPTEKIALTGNPIRDELSHAVREGSHDFLNLDQSIPVVLVLGGSQGSQVINETLLDALPQLVTKYQVIHQAGDANIKIVKETARIVLDRSDFKTRYRPMDHLDSLALRMSAGAADIIITRAGSTLFEIALWGVPAVIIPITNSNADHQRKNAYNYARTGAAVVIEETNLTPNILVSEIDRLMDDFEARQKMKAAALAFAKTDAAKTIAKQVLLVALEHDK